MIKNKDLFSLDKSILERFVGKYQYPYEILPNISSFIMEMGKNLDSNYLIIKENVWVHKSVIIEDGVYILGPAIIMENSVLRHNAYLRENVIIGPNCVIGNSCEIKNSLILGNSQIPHFNYVGDSIIGHNVHLGAGVILSNLRLDQKNIFIEKIDTKIRKIGAFIGDRVQIGCNSVINPGTVIYPDVCIYPLCVVKGVINEKEIVKSNNYEIMRI